QRVSGAGAPLERRRAPKDAPVISRRCSAARGSRDGCSVPARQPLNPFGGDDTMARPAKSTKAGQRIARARKPGRPPTASAKPAVKRRTSKSARAATAPERAPAALPRVPKLSKDELRAQVEKLERANATLRAKGREANRVAKSSAARIAEMEGEVARLEK